MGGEADIVRARHHHVRDHPRLQTAHPVGEHHGRDAAERLETLHQHLEGRGRAFVVGEPDEPHPGPGQHRAEHVQPGQHAPVDQQRLTRQPHPRPAAPVMITPPFLLRLRNQAAEVPGRPDIARHPGLRQQPLRRHPPRRLLHPGGDQLGHLVVVVAPILPLHRKLTGLRAPPQAVSPSYESCRKSPQHPEKCPQSRRQQSHPSVPSHLRQWKDPFRGPVTG